MGKVVTGKGLQEFIQSGKTEDVKNDPKPKTNEAPPLEVKDEKPIQDVGKPEPQEDIYSEEDQETKEEISKAKRFDALMRKKHRAMKEAQERAAEDERLAESQFNRARLAEQKLAETERELHEIKGKAAPKAAPEVTEPDPQKYYDDKGQFKAFEYAKDLAAYSATKAVADDRATQEKARKDTEAAEASRIASERIQKSEKLHPDYREVIEAADVRTHNAVLEYLTASEHIGEVSYYLATHPDYVERINQLHPLKAIAEIGKLELTFEAPAKVTPEPPPKAVVSGAPAPITPLSSQSSVNTNTDPAKMNFRELRAYERSRRKH